MKALVNKAYTDRITKKLHLAGETVDLSEERAAELAGKGIVRTIAEPEAPAETEEAADAAPSPETDRGAEAPGPDEEGADDPDEFEDMTVKELRELIESRGGTARAKATKAELVEIAKGL